MRWPRRLLILAGLALVLVVANAIIVDKERVRGSSRLVLLELRPVDPRALMQGDYMQLDFAEAVSRPPAGSAPPVMGGIAIMRVDEAGVATLARIDDGAPLAADELRLRFAGLRADGRIDFGIDAFFFEEGTGELYADARYGMFRVDAKGDRVLVGLADENGREISGGE